MKIEDIISQFATGEKTSKEVQKELKDLGFKANLRGKSNVVDIEELESGNRFTVTI